MSFTGRLLLTAACVLSFATAGFSQEAPTKDTIIATVNGVNITLGHVLSLSNRLPAQYQDIDNNALYDGIVDQLIQQQLLSGLIKEPSIELKLALENEKRSLIAADAIQYLYDSVLTEEAIKARYDVQYANADPILEYNTRHILVEDEDEANTIIKLLEDGGDFVALAKEKSSGPSGSQGGDLGWTGKGQFVPEFEAAMVELEAGQVSAPVKTQFGWHVIKLEATRNKPAPALETVRSEIEDELKRAALSKQIEELETGGEVKRTEQEIDPAVVKNFKLLKK